MVLQLWTTVINSQTLGTSLCENCNLHFSQREPLAALSSTLAA